MAMIAVRDVELYVEDTGAGPVLLFIHGMCGDADVWRGQVRRLGVRFRCITYDCRGHTRSTRGTEPESPDTHADDAAALISALGVRPVVVGSSGGARIAVALARRYPEMLVGAVLSEPPITSLDPVAGPAFTAEVADAVRPAAEARGAAGAVDAFFPLICPGLWAGLDEPGRDRYRANGAMMLEEFAGRPLQITPDDVAGIHVPSLVIAGTTSHPALRSIARVLYRALPDARFAEIEGSGHVTYAERPDEFADLVAAFADELAARPTGTASPTA